MRLAATSLRRTFIDASGRRVNAVMDLDLDIPTGAFMVVSGPSGCGKSTLLNLLGLLDHPTGGHLEADGAEVTLLRRDAASAFRRDYVGFLFQDAGLLEPMTVRGNLDTALAYRRVHRDLRAQRIDRTLERLGVLEKANEPVSRLSGGERLRVGLARALVGDPTLLICDEPTAALDAENSLSVARLLAQAALDGVTVVASSHDPIVISAAALHLRMAHGRRVEEASS